MTGGSWVVTAGATASGATPIRPSAGGDDKRPLSSRTASRGVTRVSPRSRSRGCSRTGWTSIRSSARSTGSISSMLGLRDLARHRVELDRRGRVARVPGLHGRARVGVEATIYTGDEPDRVEPGIRLTESLTDAAPTQPADRRRERTRGQRQAHRRRGHVATLATGGWEGAVRVRALPGLAAAFRVVSHRAHAARCRVAAQSARPARLLPWRRAELPERAGEADADRGRRTDPAGPGWLQRPGLPCVLRDVRDSRGGRTFHYAGGLFGIVPTPDEARCAAAAREGLDAFTAAAPLGNYRRIDEGHGSLRTYVVGEQSMVRVRPTTPIAPEPGWTPLDADGILWTR